MAILVFLFLFPLYALGVSHSVYGGDSGDIILASWFGGVAHPPGYPLNTMIGWVFTHLPFNATVAFKANLAAAFLSALAISLLYLICNKLTKNIFASLFASFFLAFVPLYWLYAHIYEVFQLNIVLIAAAIYFLISWRESFYLKSKNYKLLNWSAFFYGLAVFHHHTAALLLPAILYFLFKTDKSIYRNKLLVVRLIAFFALGLLPYIFVVWAALRKTPVNWDDPVSFQNLVRLITRSDYGTFTASSFLVSSTFLQRLVSVWGFASFLKADFSHIGIFFIFIGIVYSFIRARIYFWFFILSVLSVGPFFVFYSAFPLPNDFYTGLWERFILASYFLVAIFMAYGCLFVINFIHKFFRSNTKVAVLKSDSIKLLLTLSLFLIIFSNYFLNDSKTNLSRFEVGDWYGHDILVSAEPNAIVFLIGDTSLFNARYIYYKMDGYENIKLIAAGSLSYLEYREQIVKQYPQLSYPENFLDPSIKDYPGAVNALVQSNFDKFPIYIQDIVLDPDYKSFPVGLIQKLYPSDNDFSDEVSRLNDEAFSKFYYQDFGKSTGYTQYITTHIEEQYYKALVAVANYHLTEGSLEKSTLFASKAKMLLPDRKEAYAILGDVYFKGGNCSEALDYFMTASRIDSKNWQFVEAVAVVYSNCLKDQVNAKNYFDKADEMRKTPGEFPKGF
ncbi:MAG: DUF2723 domain-containing protein [Patescibacteria group bacterium]